MGFLIFIVGASICVVISQHQNTRKFMAKTDAYIEQLEKMENDRITYRDGTRCDSGTIYNSDSLHSCIWKNKESE